MVLWHFQRYITCDIDCEEDKEQWGGITFRYFEGNSYYLPIVKWGAGGPAHIEEDKAAKRAL